jgi:hypothetical protein
LPVKSSPDPFAAIIQRLFNLKNFFQKFPAALRFRFALPWPFDAEKIFRRAADRAARDRHVQFELRFRDSRVPFRAFAKFPDAIQLNWRNASLEPRQPIRAFGRPKTEIVHRPVAA